MRQFRYYRILIHFFRFKKIIIKIIVSLNIYYKIVYCYLTKGVSL